MGDANKVCSSCNDTGYKSGARNEICRECFANDQDTSDISEYSEIDIKQDTSESSSVSIPPPPPPPSKKLSQKFSLSNLDKPAKHSLKSVSTWKFYKKIYATAEENINLLKTYKSTVEKTVQAIQTHCKSELKHLAVAKAKNEKTVELVKEYTSNEMVFAYYDISIAANNATLNDINEVAQKINDSGAQIKAFVERLKQMRQEEQAETKKIEELLSKFNKSTKTGKSLLTKLCEEFKVYKEMQNSDAAALPKGGFFSRKKAPEKLIKKYLDKKTDAHSFSIQHEQLVENVNDLQTIYFGTMLKTICGSIEALEVEVNEEKLKLAQGIYHFEENEKKIKNNMSITLKNSFGTVKSQEDTANAHEKITIETGNLTPSEFLVHYDIDLKAEDILSMQ